MDTKTEYMKPSTSKATVASTDTVIPWTPSVIALVTFFLDIPAGIVLAALNWFRMGKSRKAMVHLVVGIGGYVCGVMLLSRIPDQVTVYIGFLATVLVLTYLRLQMKEEIGEFQARHKVANAKWYVGVLIGIGVWLLMFLIGSLLFAGWMVLSGQPLQ